MTTSTPPKDQNHSSLDIFLHCKYYYLLAMPPIIIATSLSLLSSFKDHKYKGNIGIYGISFGAAIYSIYSAVSS